MTGYGWQRWWAPAGADLLVDEDGFFVEPRGGAWVPNVSACRLDALDDGDCVVLLGEAGAGKSWEMRAWHGRRDQVVSARLLRLESFGPGTVWGPRVLQSPWFQQWRDGDDPLELFLDGLDEALGIAPNLPAQLLDVLGQLDDRQRGRLRARIACRTAVWRRLDHLQAGLRDLFPGWQARYLAPLTRGDVRAAAEARAHDPDDFLDSVRRAGAGPLAARPVSLEMLLPGFEEGGPRSRYALYERACRALCEPRGARKARTDLWRHDTDERLSCARRLAAVSVYCGRPVVPDDPGDSLLRETLDTGLFDPDPTPDGARWAHWSYAEFLAAREASHLPGPRVLRLLTHPEDPERRVVPAMEGTAAWLAARVPAVFETIVEREPELLLVADADALTDAQRARLTDALLSVVDAGGLHPRDLGWSPRFEALRYPGLAAGLQTRLRDGSARPETAWLALLVARDLGLEALAGDALAIALDPERPTTLRTSAVLAFQVCAPAADRQRLRPLAEEEDDDVRGAALEALWPEVLSTREVLGLLRPRTEEHVHSLGSSFVARLTDTLTPVELPGVLDWCVEHWEEVAADFDLGRLVDRAVARARDHLGDAAVLGRLAALVLRAGRRGTGPTPEEDDDRRRRVVAAAVERVATSPDPQDWAFALRSWLRPTREEVAWLLDQAGLVGSEGERERWAELLRLCLPWAPPDAWVLLPDALEDGHLSPLLAPLLEPVPLDSRQARARREDQAGELRSEQEDRRARVAREQRREEVACLAGPDAWRLTARSTHRWRISASRLWQEAAEDWRERLLEAARDFVESLDPAGGVSPDGRIVTGDASSGLRALELLSDAAPGLLDTIRRDAWLRWTRPVLFFGGGLTEVREHLGEVAGPAVAGAVMATLDLDPPDPLLFGIRLRDAWVPELAPVLAERLRGDSLPGEARLPALAALVAHEPEAAREVASDLLDAHPSGADPPVVVALLLAEDVASRRLGWERLTQASEGADAVLDLLAAESSLGRNRMVGLPTELVARAFCWLAERVPYGDDVDLDGGQVPARYELQEWRRHALEAVKHHGTFTAVDELRRIAASHPELRWLPWTIRDAAAIARRDTWSPPSAQQLDRLLADPESRLARTDVELLEVVVETLQALDARLSEEVVWQSRLRKPDGAHQDEQVLSNELADDLRRELGKRGVVVHREVEPRPRRRGRGPTVDLVVSGHPPGGGEVGLPIEVKGSWDRRLRRALAEQLVGSYLRGTPRRAGLLVVFWYDDAPGTFASRHSLEEHLRAEVERLRDGVLTVDWVVLGAPPIG